jgi:CRP-like cAMP-binding protein
MTEVALLRQHPFARGLTDDQLAQLAACAQVVRFGENQIVFREGDPATAVYLVLSGRIVLEQHVPGRGDLQVENLGGGDMVGLSWLLPAGRWLLEARAIEPTEAISLDAACLHDRMKEDPSLGFVLATHVIQQLYRRLEHVRLQRLDVYRGNP